MNKDLNYVAALERAVTQKYGEAATINPKSLWNEEKEKKYIEESKEKLKLEAVKDQENEYIDLDGVLIPKKLINSANKRKCEHCGNCYIKYIEDRQERWKQGWRPNKTEQK